MLSGVARWGKSSYGIGFGEFEDGTGLRRGQWVTVVLRDGSRHRAQIYYRRVGAGFAVISAKKPSRNGGAYWSEQLHWEYEGAYLFNYIRHEDDPESAKLWPVEAIEADGKRWDRRSVRIEREARERSQLAERLEALSDEAVDAQRVKVARRVAEIDTFAAGDGVVTR